MQEAYKVKKTAEGYNLECYGVPLGTFATLSEATRELIKITAKQKKSVDEQLKQINFLIEVEG